MWDFWFNMRRDMTGLPYYMNHQVWNKDFDDPHGIGGDQFMMAISSWRLLYAYMGFAQNKTAETRIGKNDRASTLRVPFLP